MWLGTSPHADQYLELVPGYDNSNGVVQTA